MVAAWMRGRWRRSARTESNLRRDVADLAAGTCLTSIPPRSVFEFGFTRCCAPGPLVVAKRARHAPVASRRNFSRLFTRAFYVPGEATAMPNAWLKVLSGACI